MRHTLRQCTTDFGDMERDDWIPPSNRRGFVKKLLAAAIGAITGLVPLASGLVVFLDPLRRKSHLKDFIRVASLNALDEDGSPRKFPVITNQVDAWNKLPQVPVGAVYLRRTGPQSVQALSVICPHAGCPVDYTPARQGYLCPCHNSTFALDGRINDPRSPSARGLDELEVEIRHGAEIWVKFQSFRAGTAQKIPLA
jgi:Rieske Fe-S protein